MYNWDIVGIKGRLMYPQRVDYDTGVVIEGAFGRPERMTLCEVVEVLVEGSGSKWAWCQALVFAGREDDVLDVLMRNRIMPSQVTPVYRKNAAERVRAYLEKHPGDVHLPCRLIAQRCDTNHVTANNIRRELLAEWGRATA